MQPTGQPTGQATGNPTAHRAKDPTAHASRRHSGRAAGHRAGYVASSLNAASALVLGVATLPHAPGSSLPVKRSIPAPAEFGTDVIAVREGDPLELDALAQAVSEGVLLSGQVSATAHGECTRCLDEVTYDVRCDLQELYYYPARAEAALAADPEAEPDDLRTVEGDMIDLEPMLRDVVIPVLPFSPLCQVDCPGLCCVCGARLAGDPGHHHETIDPRWAGLQELITDEDPS